ncbi:MAG TPA: dTDP-glucose 4,6-dehydratase [bacterium]|jgi:dTDP-glucose 4,6-dehydratase|nr:dTDP-glucose 4,6-dehydratase [bacterium]
MRVLVTGGAGFIGSHFIRYWLEHHPADTLLNLDALTYAGHPETIKDFEKNPRYTFIKGDIIDSSIVNALVADCDLIVHFAAETHVDRSINSSRSFIDTNIVGTVVLLEAAKNAPKPPHFHHVSTDEVFGSLGIGDSKFNEQSSYDPRSPYSASKAASDHLVRAYFHTYGLPITISNCSNNYGPYQLPEKLIPLFITNILNNKKLTLYGSGDNIRDWLYVVDHIRGIEAIIEKGKIGETYCLGGNNELTNKEITNYILENFKASQDIVEHVSDRPGHDFRYAIDYTRAERELGWRPITEFEAGLSETIQWYRDNRGWWEPLVIKTQV